MQIDSCRPGRQSRWFYGVTSEGTTVSLLSRERHEARLNLFVDVLQRIFPAGLKGKRVLDLGSNAGLFSLACLEHGADSVVAVEASEDFILQGESFFRAAKVDTRRYRFVHADVLQWLFQNADKFDVCLALGLVHHLPFMRFMEFFAGVAGVCDDVLVLDLYLAACSVAPSFELFLKTRAHPANPDGTLVLHPSPGALCSLMGSLGFECRFVRSPFGRSEALRDYNSGSRRFVVCAKRTILAPLLPISEEIGDVRLDGVSWTVLAKSLLRKCVRRVQRLIG